MMMRTLRAEIQFEFLNGQRRRLPKCCCCCCVAVALYAVTTIADDFFCFAVCSLLLFSVLFLVLSFASPLRRDGQWRTAAAGLLSGLGGRGLVLNRLANAVLLSPCLPVDK